METNTTQYINLQTTEILSGVRQDILKDSRSKIKEERCNHISLLKIERDTIVDGPGFRTSIYAAGCNHACKGCHNPNSWNINAGSYTHLDDIMASIKDATFSNVTFSGGDPLFQAEAFSNLAKRIKAETNKNIWCYTGYLFEDLVNNNKALELLQNIDVLVDGPFILGQRDIDLVFRGSRNQRFIDVQTSLNKGYIIKFKYDPVANIL